MYFVHQINTCFQFLKMTLAMAEVQEAVLQMYDDESKLAAHLMKATNLPSEAEVKNSNL